MSFTSTKWRLFYLSMERVGIEGDALKPGSKPQKDSVHTWGKGLGISLLEALMPFIGAPAS